MLVVCCTKDLGKALDAWCNENGTAREDVVHVELYGHQPPITRMRAPDMDGLSSCEKLSLSTNAIDKMQLSKSLRSLKVLSMGRNNLQRLDNSLADVSSTLEELWISYNAVAKLDALRSCKQLRVLYASNNALKALADLNPLRELPALEDAVLHHNPFYDALGDDDALRRQRIVKVLPQLKKLDGVLVTDEEREAAAALVE